MKYRKKPIVIEATQWFNIGDHPNVDIYYKAPERKCEQCNQNMNKHGWIDTLEGGHIVCPGDYVITGVHGEEYPCKPDIFDKTYEFSED